MKPAAAVVDAASPTRVPYPPKTENYRHEIELIIAIGRYGRNIPVPQALDHVYGYAIGLDITRRDLQLDARDNGRTWEFGKSFALSAPITLTVNGQPRQSPPTSPSSSGGVRCVAYLSEYEALEPGDLIMTGTPEGMNAVVAGHVIRGEVQGLGAIYVRVAG